MNVQQGILDLCWNYLYIWMAGTRFAGSVGFTTVRWVQISIILLFFVSNWSRTRWTQTFPSGFRSRTVRWPRSRGVESQKLLLQLVVFWYMHRHFTSICDSMLHTRRYQLGSGLWNSFRWDGDFFGGFLVWS